jgi:hypothetical protein
MISFIAILKTDKIPYSKLTSYPREEFPGALRGRRLLGNPWSGRLSSTPLIFRL